jgi:hypothetical protein
LLAMLRSYSTNTMEEMVAVQSGTHLHALRVRLKRRGAAR